MTERTRPSSSRRGRKAAAGAFLGRVEQQASRCVAPSSSGRSFDTPRALRRPPARLLRALHVHDAGPVHPLGRADNASRVARPMGATDPAKAAAGTIRKGSPPRSRPTRFTARTPRRRRRSRSPSFQRRSRSLLKWGAQMAPRMAPTIPPGSERPGKAVALANQSRGALSNRGALLLTFGGGARRTSTTAPPSAFHLAAALGALTGRSRCDERTR